MIHELRHGLGILVASSEAHLFNATRYVSKLAFDSL